MVNRTVQFVDKNKIIANDYFSYEYCSIRIKCMWFIVNFFFFFFFIVYNNIS